MYVRGQSYEEVEEAFWLSHLRVGFGVLVGEALGVLVYVRSSPGGPHRGVLSLIAAVSVILGLLSLFLVGNIARRPWRAGFSLAWSLASGWALAGCAHLDGGLDSPMLYLVLFPVIYAALAFRPAAVVACGLSALAELVVISANDSDIVLSHQSLFMIAVVVGGTSCLAVAASVYRTRLQENQRRLAADLAALADTDGLTGCLNHRAFHGRLATEIERAVRHQRPLSLILADIDDFKSVNDTYGHAVGDDALASVGRAFRDELRSGDCAGRLGGDEFAILLADTPLDGAEVRARRINRKIELEGGPTIALSVGVAALDAAEPNAIRFFRDADRALYHVKGTGRHGIAAMRPGGVAARLAS